MNLEISARDAEISAKESTVSDAELAAGLMDEVIGQRGVREPVKQMLERAYAELRRRNEAWTRRRVRAVFNKEASRIDHREIAEMRTVVEARKAHAAYREETARLVSMALGREADRAGGMDQGQGGVDR